MFYDFKGNYYLCPRCLVKDYNFYYQRALKSSNKDIDAKLDTGSIYPYQDLVEYFKQWCFCCANRIGQQDAFQMVKGARICVSCVSVNVDIMQYMIECIVCGGFVNTEKEIEKTL